MLSSSPFRPVAGLLLVLLPAVACGEAGRDAAVPVAAELDVAAPPPGFQRGMNLEPIGGFGGDPDLERLPASLDLLVQLGVDHVALIPSFFQRRLGDTDFVWRGGREDVAAATRAAIRLSRDRGLDVLLKPHLWLESRDPDTDTWRGDILPDEGAWPAWRRAYRDAVLGYARMAAQEDVAVISIGSELTALALARPGFWRQLAADVREVFPGRVTYAANWDRELQAIEWWGAVDSIGVDAFWPLTEAVGQPLRPEACRDRVGAIRRRLGELARQNGRPVLITEIGYRSARGAAWRPWEWHGDARRSPDLEVQATAYRCIVETFSPVAAGGAEGVPTGDDWLLGIYFWNWHADPSRGGPDNSDFTPRGKPAESILRAWFEGR